MASWIRDYSIPAFACNNTPEKLEATLRPQMAAAVLPEYPFGTELTPQEQALGASLRHIKSLSEEPAQFPCQRLQGIAASCG